MKVDTSKQISVLAAATGLVLVAIYFLGLSLHADTPDWLPNMIACIAGFELYMFGQDRWDAIKRKRAGGDTGDRGGRRG